MNNVERRLRARQPAKGTRRLRVPPRAAEPKLEELGYQRALVAMLADIDKLVDSMLMTQLDLMIERAKSERVTVGHAIRTFSAEHRLDATQLANQTRAVIGMDLYVREPWLTAASKAFVRENVQLITTMTQQQVAKTERLVLEGVRRGRLRKDIEADISKMRGVSEKQAATIARDQVGKANGELTKLRQQSLGLTRYRWRTVGDDAVRDSHAEREGEVFSWDEPPEDGHPGEPINCRCTAEPVFDDLFEQGEPSVPVTRR